MKPKKLQISGNLITVILMISSLTLLILLQFFWLRGSYEKAFVDLKKDTNLLLRATIDEMRDSLFLKNLQPVSKDSTGFTFHRAVQGNDSVSMSIARIESSTISRHVRDQADKSGSTVKIFITAPTDSLHSDVLRPLADRVTQLKGRGMDSIRSYFIRINDDTLNLDSIRIRYKKALLKNSIDIPFNITLTKGQHDMDESFFPFSPKRKKLFQRRISSQDLNFFSDNMVSDPAGLNPIFNYTASFSGVRGFLIKKITPEILFSAFLTLITAGAFMLVYSNMRAQQRLIAAKDDFISNVTHELKTPVATVSVALEALKNFSAINNPKLTQEYLEIAQRELNRLSSITDKILKTSLLEQPQLSVSFEILDLKELTEAVVAGMRLLTDAANVKLHFLADGSDFKIQGSREHISNALYNLIDNAIKYRSDDSIIDLLLRESDKHVSLVIKDNGIGIDPTYHSKIFEKFFRVPYGNIHNIKGYGLGLNYVRTVIQLHGGEVRLKSAIGKGSEFELSFPK